MNFFKLYELFPISLKLYGLVQTCMNLYELVQIGLNLSELVQTCPKTIFRKPQKPTSFWWSQHSDTFMTETDFLLIQRKPGINLPPLPPQLMIMTQNIIFIGKTCEKKMTWFKKQRWILVKINIYENEKPKFLIFDPILWAASMTSKMATPKINWFIFNL